MKLHAFPPTFEEIGMEDVPVFRNPMYAAFTRPQKVYDTRGVYILEHEGRAVKFHASLGEFPLAYERAARLLEETKL